MRGHFRAFCREIVFFSLAIYAFLRKHWGLKFRSRNFFDKYDVWTTITEAMTMKTTTMQTATATTTTPTKTITTKTMTTKTMTTKTMTTKTKTTK